MYYQASKRSVGLTIESIRGQAEDPSYWMPWRDYDFSPKMEVSDDDGSVWSLVNTTDSMVTRQRSEGNLGGRIYPNGVGMFLYATLGSVNSDNSGTNPVHTFTIEDQNDHPSLTISTHDPVADRQYANTIVTALQIQASEGGDLTMTAGLKGKKAQTPSQSLTPDFTPEQAFKTTDMRIYYADDTVSLTGADNICVQQVSLSISKEIQDIGCISSIDFVDYANKSMTIEGSLEMYRADNTYRAIAFDDIAKAMKLEITDTSVDLNGEHPSLTITLPKVKITDYSEAVSFGDMIKQTIQFKAHYSIEENKAVEAVLVNTQASY